MSEGDYQFDDGQRVRGGLTFALARKLFRECKHPKAKVLCNGKAVLWRR